MRTALLALLLPGCCALGPQAPQVSPQAEAAYAQGRAEQAAGNHALAVKAYKYALRLQPDYAAARNAIAVAYAERGHRALAAEMLRDLARTVPRNRHHAYVFNNLGYAWLQAGQPGQAREALRTALALDPGGGRAAANLRVLNETDAYQ